jgi:thioesterase domain-containing protein/acyl carrier protein
VSESVVLLRDDGAAGGRRLTAYVVPAGGREATARELQRHLRGQVPSYMVPTAFVFLDRLPLTANRKVDREALPAPESGRTAHQAVHAAPRDALEMQLVALWEELLPVRPIGIRDDFFELGGHSLLAVQLLARLHRRLGHNLPAAELLHHPTVETLAARLREGRAPARRNALVTLAPGAAPPFFIVHPVGGEVLCYVHLAREVAPVRAVHGLQVPDRPGRGDTGGGGRMTWDSIEEMAAHHLGQVRGVQPRGPYTLGGWSLGGVVAFEMARQLARDGERAEMVALIDSLAPAPLAAAGQPRSEGQLALMFAGDLAHLTGVELPAGALPEPPPGLAGRGAPAVLAWLAEATERMGLPRFGLGAEELDHRFATFTANVRALERYAAGSCAAPLVLFRAAGSRSGTAPGEAATAADLGWQRWADRPVEVHEMPGDHYSLLRQPHLATLVALLRQRLAGTVAAPEPERELHHELAQLPRELG